MSVYYITYLSMVTIYNCIYHDMTVFLGSIAGVENLHAHAHYYQVQRLLPASAHGQFNQSVQKLVAFLVVRWRTQSSGPVQLPKLIVRQESGCLAIWML